MKEPAWRTLRSQSNAKQKTQKKNTFVISIGTCVSGDRAVAVVSPEQRLSFLPKTPPWLKLGKGRPCREDNTTKQKKVIKTRSSGSKSE